MYLDQATIEDRLKSFTPDNYLYVYGIMKGIALGVGAIIVLPFLDDLPTLLPRLSLWLASIAVLMVSHTTAARGILLTSFRYSWLDTLLPLAIGIVECLLFTILQPSKESPDLWQHWYFLMAAHMFLVVLLVLNRLTQTREEDFDPVLHPLVNRYRSWMKWDILGAGVLGICTVAIGIAINVILLPQWPRVVWWQFIVGTLLVFVMAFVVAKAESERREIIEFIRALAVATP
ncbi:MAG TPA: hypothetical protein VGC79_24630 [Polyangiaceae bacterium]